MVEEYATTLAKMSLVNVFVVILKIEVRFVQRQAMVVK